MEWGDNENRVAVVALYKCGMQPGAIFETLKKLGISRQFINRTIDSLPISDQHETKKQKKQKTK